MSRHAFFFLLVVQADHQLNLSCCWFDGVHFFFTDPTDYQHSCLHFHVAHFFWLTIWREDLYIYKSCIKFCVIKYISNLYVNFYCLKFDNLLRKTNISFLRYALSLYKTIVRSLLYPCLRFSMHVLLCFEVCIFVHHLCFLIFSRDFTWIIFYSFSLPETLPKTLLGSYFILFLFFN